jgi:hypothetical protein
MKYPLAMVPRLGVDLAEYGKLYKFADMYLAESIKQSCLNAIPVLLERSVSNATTVQELVDFLRYVSEQEVTADGTGIGPVRRHVVGFIGKNMARLVTFESFRSLLAAGGELMKDIVVASYSELGQ